MAQYTGTETPLGATTTFTSPDRMANTMDRIVGTVFSSVNGTLTVEQGHVSDAGTVNYDFITSIAVTANTGDDINVALVAPKWRLKFVHAGNQTTFRLHARATSDGDDS